MNINIELYKTFYCVAKNGNITKAANELMITQPGVSKAIKTLEEQIGCSLFIRTKNGVILTDEGKIFYEQIKLAMEHIDNAEKKIKEIINLDYGFLSIGVSNTLVKKFLLPYIEKFHKLYPKIKIKINTNVTPELIKDVRNGLIDFIIYNAPATIPNDFKQTKLKKVHDIFAANSSFSDLKDKVIPLEELNKYPLILMSKGSNTRCYLDDLCSKLGVNLVPEIELTSYSLVTEFTKIGMGIGGVTREYFDGNLEDYDLIEIKTKPDLGSRSIDIAYLADKRLSRSAEKFVELLKKEY